MFVTKGNEFLPNVSLGEIEERYSQEKNAKAKIRLQCAILRKKGKSQPYLSEVTGLPVTTISGILRRFEKRGIDGCYAIKQKGQPKKLSLQERVKLKKILSKSPEKQGLPFVVWTIKLVRYFLKHKFKTEYVTMQVHRIIKELHLSLQKPRPEHIKANKKLQAQFKKNFDEELKNLCRQDMRSPILTKASLH
jgi:transposase